VNEDEIRKQRGRVYGDPQDMHTNIAQVWTAQLRSRFGQHIPDLDANMAELMLAGFKVLRASRPVPWADAAALANYLDSYPDGKNYLDFAREFVERHTQMLKDLEEDLDRRARAAKIHSGTECDVLDPLTPAPRVKDPREHTCVFDDRGQTHPCRGCNPDREAA
jgi:hypothetical protein